MFQRTWTYQSTAVCKQERRCCWHNTSKTGSYYSLMRETIGRQCKFKRISAMCWHFRVIRTMHAALWTEELWWNTKTVHATVNCNIYCPTYREHKCKYTAAFTGRNLRMFDMLFRWKSDILQICLLWQSILYQKNNTHISAGTSWTDILTIYLYVVHITGSTVTWSIQLNNHRFTSITINPYSAGIDFRCQNMTLWTSDSDV